jgi:hypothetical protein
LTVGPILPILVGDGDDQVLRLPRQRTLCGGLTADSLGEGWRRLLVDFGG